MPAWRTMLALLLLCSAPAMAEEREGMQRGQSGGVGFSGLATSRSGAAGALGPAIFGEARVGFSIGEHLQLQLTMQLVYRDFATVGSAYRWLVDHSIPNPLLWLPLGLGYLTAWLLGFNAVTAGPTLAWFAEPSAPSLFVEVGWGPSAFVDYHGGGLVLGSAFMGGVGYDITPELALAARANWSPPFLHSDFTPSDVNVFSGGFFLILH